MKNYLRPEKLKVQERVLLKCRKISPEVKIVEEAMIAPTYGAIMGGYTTIKV